jgi:hypothetical protein
MPVAEDALYRDVQNLTDADRDFAQLMIRKMLEKNQPKE